MYPDAEYSLFSQDATTENKLFVWFLIPQILMVYISQIRGCKLVRQNTDFFSCDRTLHPYGLVLGVIIQPYSCFIAIAVLPH